MPFIFEGDFQLGAVRFYLAVGNDQVLLDDLGHPQLPQMFAGELNRRLGSVLPGFRAGANHFDDFVDTLRHGEVLLQNLDFEQRGSASSLWVVTSSYAEYDTLSGGFAPASIRPLSCHQFGISRF